MGPEEINAFLSGHSSATKAMIEIFVSESNRRFERMESLVNDLRNENRNLKESLQFTQAQVDENIATIKTLNTYKKENDNKIQELEGQIKAMQQRQDEMEDQARRSNLRFDNVPETENETWENSATIVSNLLKKMDLPEDTPIERAHRIGRYDPQRDRPRTIIAKFARFRDREAAFRNAKVLRRDGIAVKEDLCQASRKKRAEQWPTLQEAWKEGKRAFFNHTKLVVKGPRAPPPPTTPALSDSPSSSTQPGQSSENSNSAATSDSNTTSSERSVKQQPPRHAKNGNKK